MGLHDVVRSTSLYMFIKNGVFLSINEKHVYKKKKLYYTLGYTQALGMKPYVMDVSTPILLFREKTHMRSTLSLRSCGLWTLTCAFALHK